VKERLTGAIILVALIVLLVPELLSGPKGPTAAAPVGAAPASSEEPPLRSYTINLGDDSRSQTQQAGSSGPAMPEPSGPEQPTPQASGPQSGAPQPSGPQSSSSQSSASQQSSALVQPERPSSSAPPAEMSRGPASVVTPDRTRSGAPKPPRTAHPDKPTKAAAEKSVKSAAAEKSVKSAGTDKSGKSGTGSAAGAASGTGWAVQLGVFASKDNAERLALEVRVKGFKASVSPARSGGRTLYRVRVGPAADRSAAQELQSRLKAAGRPVGTVVPYS
jgi:DedD protein